MVRVRPPEQHGMSRAFSPNGRRMLSQVEMLVRFSPSLGFESHGEYFNSA